MEDHSAQELLWLAWFYEEHKHKREAKELKDAFSKLRSKSEQDEISKRDQLMRKRRAS